MRRSKVLLWSVAVCVAAASCGLKPASQFSPNVEPGSIEKHESLEGVEITVTSKEFTEQLILGKIAVLALKAAGMEVNDNTKVVGSQSARTAMLEGAADLMWEYTGTGWITYLQQTEPIPDPQAQYEAVREADLEQNGIVWTEPGPFNNTYAIAVTQESADKYGLQTLSDISKVPPGEQTFCMDSEFRSRSDGFPGMAQAYGLNVPDENIRNMQLGVVYNSIASGECVFGEVFQTDARIKALDLVVLEDDKNFFPVYNPSVTIRQEVVEAHPEIVDIFNQITPLLDTETIRDLNAQVDVEGERPGFVARDWMREEGLVN